MAGLQPARWRAGVFDDDGYNGGDDIGDDLNVADWMAWRGADVRRRLQAEAAGRQAWADATNDGEDVSAPRPSDVVALGAARLGAARLGDAQGSDAVSGADDLVHPDLPRREDLAPPPPDDFDFRRAQSGDSISGLLGTSDPRAIGRFVALNGLDPRTSTIQAGRTYAVPRSFDDASAAEAQAGARLLQADDARLAQLRAQRAMAQAQNDRFAGLFNAGYNPLAGTRPGDERDLAGVRAAFAVTRRAYIAGARRRRARPLRR